MYIPQSTLDSMKLRRTFGTPGIKPAKRSTKRGSDRKSKHASKAARRAARAPALLGAAGNARKRPRTKAPKHERGKGLR